MKCKNCNSNMTSINDVIIKETGVMYWKPYLVEVKRFKTIGWEYDGFDGNGDVAFFCKKCGAKLENINEEDIIKILKGGYK
ncbi:MAG: hypothetical protein N2Z20_01115 [Elusimicrobiales bacterium]|nr:hypothetical protein [Elusimicrobiales bacterium]